MYNDRKNTILKRKREKIILLIIYTSEIRAKNETGCRGSHKERAN